MTVLSPSLARSPRLLLVVCLCGFLAPPVRCVFNQQVNFFGSLLVLAPSGLYLTSKVGCLLLHVGFSLTSKVMSTGPSRGYLRHGRGYLVELVVEVYPSML